jgi:4-hydroxy-3-methylbut-2-enyl diphosphate reductase IspH
MDLKGGEFEQFVDQYLQLFKSNRMPHAQSIYEATVERQLTMLVGLCRETFNESLKNSRPMVTTIEQLPVFYDSSKNAALLMFREARKMGNEKHEQEFMQTLLDDMRVAYDDWRSHCEEAIRRADETAANQREIERVENEKRLANIKLQAEQKRIADMEQTKKNDEETKRQMQAQVDRLQDDLRRATKKRGLRLFASHFGF